MCLTFDTSNDLYVDAICTYMVYVYNTHCACTSTFVQRKHSVCSLNNHQFNFMDVVCKLVIVIFLNCLHRVQYLHWTCLRMVIAQGARMELSNCGTQTSNL